MNKYLVTENVSFEGKNTWTVIAETPSEAKTFVKTSNTNICDLDLYIDTLKFNLKTNQKGIIKSSKY